MAESFHTIDVSRATERIAVITLNQPERRNPIGPVTIGELMLALDEIEASSEVTCVILTGAGKVFSAGGDLSQMAGGGMDGPRGSMVDLLVKMHGLGVPIIAKVNGHALAGGLGLMVACDLVVASDAATFGTTEIRLGLWPMMISAELARNIGRKKTLELMLTGERIDAAEAERIGLVNRVVPAAELDEKTLELAERIAGFSPATMRLGLRAFYGAQDMELEPALRFFEGELFKVLALEDAREGIAAFLAKRTPEWKGK